MGRTFLARLARDSGGGVTMITAGALTMMMGCAAFAVDLGSIYVHARELQGIADAAALAAATNLDDPRGAAQAAVEANGWDGPVTIAIETGNYRFDTAIAQKSRFLAGGASPDAVRVRLTSQAPVHFALAWLDRGSVDIERAATASRAKLAAFSIGSRLAAIDGGLAGQYLSQLAGINLNLSVMDYNALLSADVDLLSFSEALGSQIDVTALSFDDILASKVAAPKAFSALAAALDAKGEAQAASAARQIASRIPGTQIDLSRLIDLGPYGAQDHAGRAASVETGSYALTEAMLELAGGNRQVKLDLGASVPGLASTSVWIAVGDRPANSPWLTVTDRGETIVRTAQTRIFIDAQAPGSALLKGLGIGSVRVPLFVELASAEAKLNDIQCGSALTGRSVKLDVRPSVGHISVADIDTSKIDDHKTPLAEKQAVIVSTLLLKVKGQSRTDVGGLNWQTVGFNADDIAKHNVKTVSTNDIIAGVAASLGKVGLTVDVLGLPINTAPITSALGAQLAALAGPLDALLNTLTDVAGAKLGQADVRINGVRCGQPALVA